MADLKNRQDVAAALKDVERNSDGIIVLSPYGFTIKEIKGKKYVVSLTESECIADFAMRAEEIGECFTPVTGPCIQNNCTEKCVEYFTGHSFKCKCSK